MRQGWSVRGLAALAAGCAVVLTGCASTSTPGGAGPVVESGRPVASPYSGPLSLPVSTADDASVLARSGAAGRALQCDAAPYAGGRYADYRTGLAAVAGSAGQALAAMLTDDGDVLPHHGYRLERDDGDRVLFSFDVGARTKVAVVVAAGVRDYLGGSGWGVETWASCDPAELPASVTDAVGLGVWTDRSGRRVPVTRIQSVAGPAHCDWQSVTFLSLGSGQGAALYLRDPAGVLADVERVGYLASTPLPAGATDTGYGRQGSELWLAADRSAAYLVGTSGPDHAERWPATTRPVGCA